jgi:hypothetical protein
MSSTIENLYQYAHPDLSEFETFRIRQAFREREGHDLTEIQEHLMNLVLHVSRRKPAEILEPDGIADPSSRIFYCYFGKRRGHTTLWRVLQKTYPDKFILASFTREFAKWQEFPGCHSLESLRTIALKREPDSMLADRILIYDASGCHSSVRSDVLNTLLRDGKVRSIIVS